MIKRLPGALLLLAASSIAAASEPSEIPFRFTDGFIQVEARLASSPMTLSMLLDSGASVSVLNRATADRLGIPRRGSITVRGVSSDSQAGGIEPIPLTVSGIPSGAITLAADMSHARDLCSGPIDGLIGVDFFRDRIVQIDYERQRLRFLPRPVRSDSDLRLPLKLLNDVACVGVGVNGSSLRWTRIDTGCNDCLHWVIPRRGWREKSHSASIGFVTESRDLALARVALGRQAIHSVPTSLHGRPFFDGEAGLLGNELLSRFTVTLDWPGRTLILRERDPRQQ